MAEVTRREFAKTAAGRLAVAGLGSSAESRARVNAPLKQPNIVFVCSDQHSSRYAGYEGHPLVRTPNLDHIAKRGVIFTTAYCGHPVCVAGRASMMTGMYASDCDSFCNSTVWDGSHPTWATRLSEKGYYCRAIGKMDLNDDFDTGFEEIETSHGHRHNPDITSLFRRPLAYRIGQREGVTGTARQQRHADADRTSMAVSFIEKQASLLDGPWALYVGLTEPHPPFVALQQYFEMYPSYSVDMPNLPPGHLGDLHLVFERLRHFLRIATPIPEESVRRARAGYYGLISELDEYVGQIWNALVRANLLQNTVFIYTSDHGESLGEHGLWYKTNLYENAVRVPLLVAGGGVPQGVRVEHPVAHVDLVATVFNLASIEIPNSCRGRSLLPLIQKQPGVDPSFVLSECHSQGNCTGSFMIRKGAWKYIHFSCYENLLFNLQEDPGEFNNLIDVPDFAEVREELRQLLRSQLDPEEVTMRAFRRQEAMLKELADKLNEDELFARFKGRMGPGLARILAAKCKGR